MHTLNGQPAYFCLKEVQIFFAHRGSYNSVRLMNSVEEIHRNEKISRKNRREFFGESEDKWKHGWLGVIVDA